MINSDLIGQPALTLARMIRDRDTTSVEVCGAFLDRIESASALNAVAHLDRDSVLRHAAVADEAVARGEVAPLLGVPFSVKDSIAVEGWPWRSGSFAREDVVAGADATAVSRLRSAGAIPLCKTATPEYTWSAQTASALQGYTNNPYELKRSTGGSSGGEAALHAVNAAPFGLGTDGFCSIRLPAHFCGTVGFRPTAGVVPETGTWPLTRATGMMDISTTGPMGAHASDLGVVLELISGPDPGDPLCHPLQGRPLSSIDLSGRMIGVLPESALEGLSSGTRQALADLAAYFVSVGAVLHTVDPWETASAVDLAFTLMAPDGGEQARANLAAAEGRHHPEFAGLLEALASTTPSMSDYLRAVDEWRTLRAHVRSSIADCLVTLVPVASGPAPLHDRLPGADDAASSVEAFNHSFSLAMAGVPSAVIPVRMEQVGDGVELPIGIQLIGVPHSDYSVLAVASAAQEHFRPVISRPTAWAITEEESHD
jgi:Asp-tRNA(Asn)/Glu-tRNA(Gln) amidotransferase A subunit family amidase